MATEKEQTEILNETIESGDLSKLLKEYRQAAHLNIDQISEALCLTSSSIHSLENEAFNDLPESPYVRGYLRNYARLADKDPSHIIEVYNTLRNEAAGSEHTIEMSTGNTYQELANPLITPQRFRMGLLALLLLLLALLTMIPSVRNWASTQWTNFSNTSDTLETTNKPEAETLNLPSLTGELPGNLPIAPEENTATPEPTETTESETASGDEEAPADEASTEVSTDTESDEKVADEDNIDTSAETNTDSSTSTELETTESEDNAEQTEQEATPTGDTNLKFVFSDEVWLRIKNADGKTLYEALHPAGTEKTLSLDSPLKLKVGNAPAMSIFVNGEEMDTSEFTKGSVAKFGIE